MPVIPSRGRKIGRQLLFSFLLLGALVAAGASSAAGPATGRDPVASTLAGEFALSAGRLDAAAGYYLDAARASEGDVGLADRATRIALVAKDDARTAAALELWRERAPESLEMRGAEVTLALRRGDERAARRGLDALLADPDPAGYRQAARALAGSGADPVRVARQLDRLVKTGAIPEDLQAWLLFGGVAQRLGQPDTAGRIVAEIVRRFPLEPRVALLRASQQREAGDMDGARDTLRKVQDSAASIPALRLSVAAEYDQMGDHAAAERVLAAGPQDERIFALRASLLARAEDEAGLAKLYAALEAQSSQPDPAQRLLLGQVAEYLKRYPEALEWYRSVPAGEPRWIAKLRATKVLHDLARRDEAYAELRALQADASADDDTRRAAYLLEAELHLGDKAAEPELDAYARALAAYPDDASILYARALLWERRDEIPRAEADFRRILATDPENVAALNALGYTLADRTTRYAEALELIDRARVAEPESAAIIDSHGWVLYRLGRKDEALAELRRAFALQKDAEIAAHLAQVLWETGKRDEARRYFDEAKRIDPDNRSLLRALEKTGA